MKTKPFRAQYYNLKKISHLETVVTPPYDVINKDMQDDFYKRSDYNFVRIDLTKEEGDARYIAAQKVYENWIKENILVRDETPAFYFHHQSFVLPDGKSITRKGFFGTRKIEDFSYFVIKPHEKTLDGPKTDRLKLTRAVRANLSPIFSLYSDPQKKIDRLVEKIKATKPMFDFKTIEGERHEVWKVVDAHICQEISTVIDDQPLFIADGHHRYETALNYRNEMRATQANVEGEALFEDVMMYFSNRNDDGLIILPIHRALHHLSHFSIQTLLKKLEGTFHIKPYGALSPKDMTALLAKAGKGTHAYLLITKDADKNYLISISHENWLNHPVTKVISRSLVGLDVTVLHRFVFEELLGISQEAQAKQENIIYWKDTGRAVTETRKGECDVTFLLNPTHVKDMEMVAMAGEKMPQKSTYFYPKILSGLVIYPLD